MTKLYKTADGPVAETADGFHLLGGLDWDSLVNRDKLKTHIYELTISPLKKFTSTTCTSDINQVVQWMLTMNSITNIASLKLIPPKKILYKALLTTLT